jgi:hypothetical protein
MKAPAMKDTIEIDLATLKHVLKHGLDPGFNTLQGCVPEISISPEILAALRAGDFGAVGSVVGPSELGPATLAVK